MLRLPTTLLLSLAAAFLGPPWAHAGGGATDVVVVVNSQSWASLAVANEYVRLRGVPPIRVIYLDKLSDLEQMDIEAFRREVLGPLFGALLERGLAGQVDYVLYSADIPTAVDIGRDLAGKPVPPIITPWASLNGLTYLHGFVRAGNPAYAGLTVNGYARRPLPMLQGGPLAEEKRAQYAAAVQLLLEQKWHEAEPLLQEVVQASPRFPEGLYNLACCLARLDRPEEAVALLRRAWEAGFINSILMETDEDLRSLQEREDMRALLAAMRQQVFDVQPTMGFRERQGWDLAGNPVDSGGVHYMLSTVLGVTSGRGNSVQEVLQCLRRSAGADGTRPPGTIYFMVNQDIRSRTRQWGFAAAVEHLQRLGVRAVVAPGVFPRDTPDVAGAMVGAAGVDPNGSGSTILPGAICEHLTSLGGVMTEDGGQTPLTDFIRAGAAGASGTVTEPYAIQAKFPDPFLQVHYARGCSLAEAFYQSVQGPYQLLIVGDALCQPWSQPPRVSVSGLDPEETVRGTVSVRPEADRTVASFMIFVDGRRVTACAPGGEMTLDTTGLADGWHDLRVVAVSADPIMTQGQWRGSLRVSNHGLAIQASGPADPVPLGDRFRVSAQLPGATALFILHNARVLAAGSGDSLHVDLDSRLIGMGKVELFAGGVVGEGAQGRRAVSAPIPVEIGPPATLPPLEVPGESAWAPGLALELDGAPSVAVESTKPRDWLASRGAHEGSLFRLTGWFEVPAEEVYQVQVRTDGVAAVRVNEVTLCQVAGDTWCLAPVSLAPGTHRLVVAGVAGPAARLQVRFGGPGALSVAAPRFRHLPTSAPSAGPPATPG